MSTEIMQDLVMVDNLEAIIKGFIKLVLHCKENYPDLVIEDLKNIGIVFSQKGSNIDMNITFKTIGGVTTRVIGG